MNVALYARVSTRDGRQFTENQRAELRRFAGAHGWTIAREYEDQESGATGPSHREQLELMLDDAAQRKFDRVVVWALDRLTREGVCQTFAYIQRLKASGVDFWSMTEEHFRSTGPAGELFIAIAAWIAQQERARHIERVRAGVERARREGRTPGRPRHAIDLETAQRMRDDGVSLRNIARQMKTSPATLLRRLGLAPTLPAERAEL